MARGFERPPWWAVVVIVVGLVWIAVGVPIALHRAAAASGATAVSPAVQASTPATKTPPTAAQAVTLLDQPTRPWTLTVLGDSTGNESTEWVYLLGRQLSAKYSRPVVIHDWSIDTNNYSGQTPVGGGGNAPITVWNGSASGMTAGYSLQNFAAMAPQQPDLVIVNHGHNEPSADVALSEVGSLFNRVASAWPQPPAMALVLQNPRTDATAAVQEQVVQALRTHYADSKVSLIDAHAAFQNSGKLPTLLNPDGKHPNAAGERLWAQTVETALGVA